MIRKTLDTDIPTVMAIYDAARAFMRAHGNATQWPEGTPSAEQLAADIAADGSYVCEVDGRVVATFAFLRDLKPKKRRKDDKTAGSADIDRKSTRLNSSHPSSSRMPSSA